MSENAGHAHIYETRTLKMLHTANWEMVLLLPDRWLDARQIEAAAHRGIADFCGIPWSYYEHMRLHAPELLADNVNHWFRAQSGKRRLVFDTDTATGKVTRFESPKRAL